MAWNGSDSGKVNVEGRGQEKKSSNFNYKALIAGLIVVFVGGLAVWLMSGEKKSADTPKERKPARIAEQKPAAAPKPKAEESAAETPKNVNPVWAAAKGLDPSLFPYDDGRKVIETRTNEWMAIDICIMPDGARRKVRRNVAKQLFKHSTDMVLMQALSTGADEVGPPIPFSEDMEQDFLESLKTPIVIDDDDTPEQRETKELVIAARENVAEQIKQGRSFFDAVNDHLESQRTGQSARETVMEAVQQLKDAGESDLVDKYLEESNKALENMGIGPVLKSEVDEDASEDEETSKE